MCLEGTSVYWVESRPAEGGRAVLMRQERDGQIAELTPAPFNVRTRVHEYGGGAHAVHEGTVYFSHFADGLIYQVQSGMEPVRVAGSPGMRYADFLPDPVRGRLICVREDHANLDPDHHQPQNCLIAVDLATGQERVLAAGADFCASACLSPDGRQLAWLSWNHPNMPWDGTDLWLAAFAADGGLSEPVHVAGGVEESIFQPAWSPDGLLHFVSDRTGWWNLYRHEPGGAVNLMPMAAEFGQPQWRFGMSTYGFDGLERIVAAYTQGGLWHLAVINRRSGELAPLPLPYSQVRTLRVGDGQAALLGGAPTEPACLVRVDLASGEHQVLRQAGEVRIDSASLSEPVSLEFPTEGGLRAYALYYAPKNARYQAPDGELPPLIVSSHGGPTGAASPVLSPEIQYWTSRGFAVVDVNYGGSTGYGRAYRERLNGNWGVVDVADCLNAARYLAAQGMVDGQRMAIRGGSAGGYTTLAALTFHDLFQAGASLYGISDLELLAVETHKFESRYGDRLIGPYPQAREIYRSRSPIHFVDQLSCPVIFFQGLDDKVVPPNQAELMVDALRSKGIPVAYVTYAGEGHGFRRAENIIHALEAQLAFYGRIFGFTPAEPVPAIVIENL